MFATLTHRLFDFVLGRRSRLPVNYLWSARNTLKVFLLAGLILFAATFIVQIVSSIILSWLHIVSNEYALHLPLKELEASGFITSVTLLVSFVFGFGEVTYYLCYELRQTGQNVLDILALNFKASARKTKLGTVWAIIWRPIAAYIFFLGGAILIGLAFDVPEQDTIETAKNLRGVAFLIFSLSAIIAAPIFEEIVFRGFLFNALRGNFRLGKIGQLFGKTIADYSAIVLSAIIFALGHMQFQLVTIVLLFFMGCLLAEVYRRSGSLYCAIILHAINNGLTSLTVYLGQ
jgi:membrane protease YdiL (CAAX protease family)